jgi:hypothetical protein
LLIRKLALNSKTPAHQGKSVHAVTVRIAAHAAMAKVVATVAPEETVGVVTAAADVIVAPEEMGAAMAATVLRVPKAVTPTSYQRS